MFRHSTSIKRVWVAKILLYAFDVMQRPGPTLQSIERVAFHVPRPSQYRWSFFPVLLRYHALKLLLENNTSAGSYKLLSAAVRINRMEEFIQHRGS